MASSSSRYQLWPGEFGSGVCVEIFENLKKKKKMVGRKTNAWAAKDSSALLSPYSFHLREASPDDILIKVLYCGLDHTDLLQMKNQLSSSVTNYPLVPGHEVVGQVLEIGEKVNKFIIGDIIGVGGIIASCGQCNLCTSNLEQYCNQRTFPYNDIYKDGTRTQGGFSSLMVFHQSFAVKIPEELAPEQAAPLLCAGVTAYSPLKQFMNSGKLIRGGILGLGGVGHLGVIIAKAMGHNVTVISSSERKKIEAIEHLHADAFLVSTNEAEMKRELNSLDYILDTVPAVHPVSLYLSLLKPEGKLIIVGAPPEPLQFSPTDLILGKKSITGSFVGSVTEMQELLNFWVEKGLASMIEVVKMDYVNKAFERMEKNDVRYRFVLDVAGSNFE